MKKIVILLLLFSFVSFTYCVDIKTKTAAEESLILSIEHNMQMRVLEDSCEDYYDNVIESVFIIIPLNEDIINNSIELYAERNRLDMVEKNKLINNTYQKYLNGDESRFLIYIYNKVKNNRTYNINTQTNIYFKNLPESIYMKSENGVNYPLKSYTSNIDGLLNPGWNKGYLTFKNIRKEKTDSYSIHFKDFFINANITNEKHKARSWSWALSFDNSKIGFMDMIKRGIKIDELRNQYTNYSFNKANLSWPDIISIVADVLGILSILI